MYVLVWYKATKPGHTESDCRTLKSAIAELKKGNAKKSVAFITATPAEVEEDGEESFEAVHVHSTETVMHNQCNPLYEDLVLCDHCASASIFKNKNLLTNLRPSGTITFTGIGGSIDVTQQGDFGVFGTIAYDERATFNVISVDSLPKSSVVAYDHAARCHIKIGGVPTEQEEIRGDSTQDATDKTTENPAEDTTSVTAKVVKPRVKFVRESYMMTERSYVM